MHDIHDEWILILDYGSQLTQLIARRLRELNIYCEIHAFNHDLNDFTAHPPKAIVLSGSPRSVNDEDAPTLNPAVLDFDVPILGICYGLQALAHLYKPGSVDNKTERREFGRAKIIIDNDIVKNGS